MSAANDERWQVLNPRVIWDECIVRFEFFRNNVEVHCGKIGAGYLFDTEFQTAYIERGADCFVDFLDEVPSASQISACQGGLGRRILMDSRIKQDGIRRWHQLVN